MTDIEPPSRLWKRERIRLDLATYAEAGQTWLITIATLLRDRRDLADASTAKAVVECLATSHHLNHCTPLAYCVMPDHVHAVTQVGDGGDLVKLVSGFKSFSTRAWWGTGGSGTLWQRSFHDRGLRTMRDVEAMVGYVWENPVRAGLIWPGERYPYVGGALWEEPERRRG